MKWSYSPERKEEIKRKRRQTMLDRYGVESALQSSEFQQKFKQTMVEKYGVEHALQSTVVQSSMKQNNLENWGVENVFQSEEIKKKSKKSMIQRHGVEYAQQSEAVKEKAKQTNLEKYGVEYSIQSPQILALVRQTMLKKYGVEYYSQSEDYIAKCRQTSLQNWGVKHPFQSEEIQNKIKQTNLQKYGVERAVQSELVQNKIKQTNLQRYGADNPAKCKQISELAGMNLSNVMKEKFSWQEPCVLEACKENPKASGTVIANITGISGSHVRRIQRKNGLPPGSITFPEQQIIDLLKVHFPGLKTLIHDRTTLIRGNQRPLEIDILIPSLNLGIEVNGSYWHQDDPEDYKYNKYLLAKEKGIDLLHLHVENKFDENTLMIILEIVEKSYEIS